MAKEILFDIDARKKMEAGVDKLADTETFTGSSYSGDI